MGPIIFAIMTGYSTENLLNSFNDYSIAQIIFVVLFLGNLSLFFVQSHYSKLNVIDKIVAFALPLVVIGITIIELKILTFGFLVLLFALLLIIFSAIYDKELKIKSDKEK